VIDRVEAVPPAEVNRNESDKDTELHVAELLGPLAVPSM
jgi:hypothetical protein